MTRAKHSPTGRVQRDMTRRQFLAACKSRGYKPEGFMGYFALPTGLRVSVLNTNSKRLRTWLAYLVEQHANDVAKRDRETKAEAKLRAAGYAPDRRQGLFGWWKDDTFLAANVEDAARKLGKLKQEQTA